MKREERIKIQETNKIQVTKNKIQANKLEE